MGQGAAAFLNIILHPRACLVTACILGLNSKTRPLTYATTTATLPRRPKQSGDQMLPACHHFVPVLKPCARFENQVQLPSFPWAQVGTMRFNPQRKSQPNTAVFYLIRDLFLPCALVKAVELSYSSECSVLGRQML